MMGKQVYRGSKIVPVRLDDDTMERITALIRSRNERSAEEPWTVSDFVRHCIQAKVRHGLRAQAQCARKRKS
jgi:hypothetical protein